MKSNMIIETTTFQYYHYIRISSCTITPLIFTILIGTWDIESEKMSI